MTDEHTMQAISHQLEVLTKKLDSLGRVAFGIFIILVLWSVAWVFWLAYLLVG
ncbi:MAG: hypothetical protein M5U22_18200 [Thermoleophilia bacterium]|nr:hypothetical protein [Thermoleophilia bacterium]